MEQRIIGEIINSPEVRGLVGLVVVNLVFGILAAARRHEFDWSKLNEFIGKDGSVLAAYFLLVFLIKIGNSDQLDTFLALRVTIVGTYGLYLLRSIAKSLGEILDSPVSLPTK